MIIIIAMKKWKNGNDYFSINYHIYDDSEDSDLCNIKNEWEYGNNSSDISICKSHASK